MVKKPDYLLWIKIHDMKEDHPNYRYRDIQKRLNVSPNTIVKSLKQSKEEILVLMKEDMRYNEGF